MSGSVDNDSEILLGNKQLLAVFAVVAFLLAVAFTGGYMLGRNSAEKKAGVTAETPATTDTSSALVTHSVSPTDDAAPPKPDTSPDMTEQPAVQEPKSPPASVPPAPAQIPRKPVQAPDNEEPVLGRRNPDPDAPKAGQTFIQVAAMSKPQAEGMAEVLRKQNFQARIAPKPGTTIYRVLVGPAKDAGEITATRDALRKIGFRDVIVQRY